MSCCCHDDEREPTMTLADVRTAMGRAQKALHQANRLSSEVGVDTLIWEAEEELSKALFATMNGIKVTFYAQA